MTQTTKDIPPVITGGSDAYGSQYLLYPDKEVTPWGEYLDGPHHGNELEGAMTIELSDEVDPRLQAISELRSAMMQSPQEGDDFLLFCLELDEQVVERGGDEELVSETYPDFARHIAELIAEIQQWDPTLPPELPAEAIDELSMGEAHQLVEVLFEIGAHHQSSVDLAA